MKPLQFLFMSVWLCLTSSSYAGGWEDLRAYAVTEDSPIVFSPNDNTLVLEDSTGSIGLEEAINRTNEFKSPKEMGLIDARKHYWILQRIQSHLDADRSYSVEQGAKGWLSLHTHILDKSGKWITLKIAGTLSGYSHLSDIDPALPGSAKVPSFYPGFTLHQGSTVTLLTHAKPLSATPPKTFVLRLVNNEKFLEVRRFGVYVMGGLTGILFSLAVFSWYSFYRNKDRASLMYGLWIIFAFLQATVIPTQDTYHLSEFFFNANGMYLGNPSLSVSLFIIVSVAQVNFYFLFTTAFLQIARYYPKTQWMVYGLVAYFVLHNIFLALSWEHNVPPQIFYLGNAVIPLVVLGLLYKAAFERYQQGMSVAMFWLIASVPYLFFRLIFVAGIMGYPSPFSYLPESGVGYLLQNTYVSQAIGVCLEAIIMSLAVVARNNWIQNELTKSLAAQKTLAESQKSLVENQNKVLEQTVAERTKELAEQHQALDQAHQLVVGSVNYASRLQRSQLPRPQRIDGRFASFATIWEPRDTIGGDLYWVSSSQHQGPFVLAVADCTGHGVPGAMLSLLVSNSLERIYANDTMEDPVSALTSLDHYVRTGLNQDRADSESDDGCDATVLRIDRRLQRLEFAGAKIDLFHVTTNGVVTRYLAQRVSLGYKERVPLSQVPPVKVLSYQQGDMFAIVTDGLTDQVGGGAGKSKISYGYRRLERLLSSHAGEHAQKVVDALRHDFSTWQGQNNRRDDVTAVVFTL